MFSYSSMIRRLKQILCMQSTKAHLPLVQGQGSLINLEQTDTIGFGGSLSKAKMYIPESYQVILDLHAKGVYHSDQTSVVLL